MGKAVLLFDTKTVACQKKPMRVELHAALRMRSTKYMQRDFDERKSV